MALRSANLNQISDYVLKQERQKDAQGNLGDPIEGATVFKLRRLSPRLIAFVKDQATEFRPDPEASGDAQMKASFLPHKCAFETVRLALSGWENLLDADGNAVDFESRKRNVAGANVEVAADASMNHLDMEWIRELSDFIDGENTVSEQEEKASA